MNNIQKLVSYIKIGIHRVSFSLPIIYTETLINYLNMYCHVSDDNDRDNDNDSGRYNYLKCFLNNNRVSISIPINSNNNYSRSYVNVYSPSQETQLLLKFIFASEIENVIIVQLEIPIDIYTKSESSVKQIKTSIDHHVTMKYKRSKSYKVINDTQYIGRNGNIRDGKRGSRCYIKKIHNDVFSRFEIQLNREYLRENQIDINSMPFNPIEYQPFDCIELLDNISQKKLLSITRTILRRRELHVMDRNYKSEFKTLSSEITKSVLGGTRGPSKKVSSQIRELQSISKKYEISIDVKQCFPKLHNIKQLIVCHIAIGYNEENCSKRLICCQNSI